MIVSQAGNSGTSKTSVPAQVERDFGNPVRFYKAISLRQKNNPIFLSRQLRPKTSTGRSLSKYLNIDASVVIPSAKGSMIFSLISMSNFSAIGGLKRDPTLSVLSTDIFPVEEDENFKRTIQLITPCSYDASTRNYDLVLMIAFHPLLPEGSGTLSDSIKAHMVRVFANSHRPRMNDNLDPTAIHVCMMDIGSKLVSLRKSNHVDVTSSSSRSWMWPVLESRQEIILSAQPIVDLVKAIRVCMGSQIYADIEVTWSSVKQYSEEENNQNNTNDDSPSSCNVQMEEEIRALESSDSRILDKDRNVLVYHFMYKDPETQLFQTKKEIRNNVECIWCGSYFGTYCKRSGKRSRELSVKETAKESFSCNSVDVSTKQSIEYLLLHLKSCHFHFEYHAMKDQEGNLFIFMIRDRSEDLNVYSLHEEKRITYDWRRSDNDKSRESLLHYELATIKVPPSLSRPAPKGKPKPSTTTTTSTITTAERIKYIPTRQYYHPRTGIPIVNEELGFESDDECDGRWDLMMASQSLDEFTDVGYEEKVFMKLWNTYVASFPPYGDNYVPLVCEKFVTDNAVQIVNEHLRYHCLFHFIVIYDFGLLRSDEVQHYISIIDNQVKMQKEAEEAERNKEVEE